MKKITLFIEHDTPINKYVFDFIFEIIGIPYKQVYSDHNSNVDIYYGNNPNVPLKNLQILSNKSDILWKDLLKKDPDSNLITNRIEFDVINAIKCLLTDSVNTDANPEAFDKHSRLKNKYSFQSNNNISITPIVNVYISFLRQVIKEKFSITGIPLWPDNKKCAIGLSHDVDNPDKYAILNRPFYIKGRKFKENIYLFLRKMTYYKMYFTNRKPNEYWLFDKIINLEKSFGFKSTFYFASQNVGDKWTAGYDVPYDIDSNKFKKVFDTIKQNRFEIGLHASYYAHLSLDRFIHEKKKLEKKSGVNVKGLRHHYWSMGGDVESTLELHAKANFEYDSSISFNDEIGFRRNVALPFYPWNHQNSYTINTLQLPVFFMDSHFSYPPSEKQVEDNVETIKNYINSIKKYQGIGIIDNHVRSSYPQNNRYRNWAITYQKILEYLSEDDEIWVDSLINISSWLKKRKALIN